MGRPLIILGTGGNAYDVLDIVDAMNADGATSWEVTGFLDDARAAGTEHLGLPVLGRLSEAPRFVREWFINAIGSDASFAKRPQIISSTGLSVDRFATLVHPSASISSRAQLGRGVYANSGVSVAGNVTVGDHVALGPGCIVGHDSTIGDFSMLAPAAVISGFVRVGTACYAGAGALVKQRVTIGDRALIGMGAVVTRDVAPATVVAGCPARAMPR
jgi:sugar O-acyltransferase (sialic acid O-acetyltransferase NeuD family)